MADEHQPVTPVRPVLVTLPAEVDTVNADSIYKEITAEFARGARIVIADMSGTAFCDTMATRTLIRAHRRAVASGNELRLVMPAPWVIQAWRYLGADAVLPLYRSVADALAAPG